MTKIVRKSQAERSGEMRSRIAKAAFEVIADRGHSAFRTAAVLAHAGVSQGAMLHHFPTKEAITLAAIEHGLNLENETSLRRIAEAQCLPKAILAEMATDFRDFFLGNRFWVALDITMDAAKDASVAPVIREIAARARRPIYDQWADKLESCGWNRLRAQQAVTMTAALISGYAARTLWTDDGDALDKAITTWFDFLLREPSNQ
jgi:AcrR family transcriptional regulator